MKFLVLSIVVLAALYGGYKLLFPNYPTYSWHQKMTVEVETPDGIKTGSSVISVKWVDGSNPANRWNHYIRGEAVVIDMGDGGYLYALLRGLSNQTNASLMFAAAISKRKGRVTDKKLFAEVVSKRDRASGLVDLPDHLYPTLVTFEDIDTPTTVKIIEPHDFVKYFGEGMKLKRITLEVVEAPLTWGRVENILTWISGHKGRLRPYSGSLRPLADVPLADLLNSRDFRRTF